MPIPHLHSWANLFDEWSDDSIEFVRQAGPKIVFVAVTTCVIILFLRWMARRTMWLKTRQLPGGVRSQQVSTLAKVISDVGSYVVGTLGALEILALCGLNLQPLLASAGIAGIAIGFGSQALIKDVLTGFFILFDDQYALGDKVQIAGVKGTVEEISLRRTILRDDDGSLYTIPNSEIRVVSNLSRDWAQLPITVTVPYQLPSQEIERVVTAVAQEFAADSRFTADLEGPPQFAGLDRTGNGTADYLILLRSRPTRQFVLARELRLRIKERFEQEQIPADNSPARVYVATDPPTGSTS